MPNPAINTAITIATPDIVVPKISDNIRIQTISKISAEKPDRKHRININA